MSYCSIHCSSQKLIHKKLSKNITMFGLKTSKELFISFQNRLESNSISSLFIKTKSIELKYKYNKYISREYSQRSVGIIGLPNIGKSALFNAIVKAEKAKSANYPFATIKPNESVVYVPDERLNLLSEMAKTKRIVPAQIKFWDIAGLVKNASKGEGLGNAFLEDVRRANMLVHVVRCHDVETIVHVEATVDSVRDCKIIENELMMSDFGFLEKAKERLQKKGRNLPPSEKHTLELINHVYNAILEEKFDDLSKYHSDLKKYNINLLSTKPVIYVCNVNEQDFSINNREGKNKWTENLREYLQQTRSKHTQIHLSAQIEAECSLLEEEEQKAILNEYGLESSQIPKLIRAAFDELDLIQYFTVGVEETRSWLTPKNSTAPEAAGQIHSDMEEGFIKADKTHWKDYLDCKCNDAEAKRLGKLTAEGKNYIVQDGDVLHFKFNAKKK